MAKAKLHPGPADRPAELPPRRSRAKPSQLPEAYDPATVARILAAAADPRPETMTGDALVDRMKALAAKNAA